MMAPAVSIEAESIVSSSSSSSISSLSSASGNTLTTLSKAELDRLIVDNMTSVLKSIKKRKHAKKHARIRQAAAAEAATVEGTDAMAEKGNQNMKKKGKAARKNELNIERRRISPRKNNSATVKNGDSKTEPLQPKTKHEASRQSQSESHAGNNQQSETVAKNGKENKTINAFQLMMGARSKSLGSNSPGKDQETSEISPTQQIEREEKAKRKLQLLQWAERKGAGKRKLQEEAEGEYIEHQLKKRAKRLKKLIGNMEMDQEADELEIIETTPKGRKLFGNMEMDEKEQELEIIETTPKGNASAKSSKSVHQKQPNKLSATSSTVLSPQSQKHAKDSTGGGCRTKDKAPKTLLQQSEVIIDLEYDANDEFLKQLSSPRKKKDSLLGYFNKVSTDGTEKDNKPEASTSSPPSSRPRRSCANRIKDYAAFERFTPDKDPKSSNSKKTSVVTPLKIINVQSPNAMKVVRSPSLRMFTSSDASNGDTPVPGAWPTTPKSVKLAPVFSKATVGGKPQTVVDPEKAHARHLFLMSGIPEKMRQEMEKRTAYEEYVLNESPVFPTVSHVMQLDREETGSAGCSSTAGRVDFRRSCIKLQPASIESPRRRGPLKCAKVRKIRFGLFTGCSVYDYETALIKCVEQDDADENEHSYELPEVENVKAIVRDYKQRYQHFPVFKCYKQFRTIYHDHQLTLSDAESVGTGNGENPAQNGSRDCNGGMRTAPSVDPDDSIQLIEPTHYCRNGEMLFTEKYKPQNTEQILVNYVPATLLKRFLSLWQDDGVAGQRRTNNGGMAQIAGDYFTSGTAASGWDHDLSNDSNSSSANGGGGGAAGICNHVVLVGPPGCGKTCNVYAVAKEMNFNVLEINASSRRKGKIILQELLEATQSHQVRQKPERSNSFDGLLSRPKATGGARGSKKGGLLMNGGFSCLERRASFSETNGNGSKKLSLILIEDADIVFEQDDGFLGAINQLVATSKRPIVLTTTNPSCAHMARYMTRNNVIRYVAPGIANVAKFLSLLALVERIPIDQHDLGRLYAHNGKDMRKTLNELQFFLQSGGDMAQFLVDADANVFDPHDEPGDVSAAELNETREEECEQPGMDDESTHTTLAKKGARNGLTKKQDQHVTLYQLFTRNQNEEMVLRLPLDFDTLWCNMELVLREAKIALNPKGLGGKDAAAGKKRRLSTPKRPRRRDVGSQLVNASSLSPEEALCDDLGFLYENISRAEAGWGVTERNRVRYGRDLQDDQQQQQLANEMRHALVEGSWIDWFDRRRAPSGRGMEAKRKVNGNGDTAAAGAKAYDGLRRLDREQRQTISSFIGLNGIRSRVTACDYEPLLRQICRHERDRSAQERRGSRFYHYLRNFGSYNAAAGASTLSNAATPSASGFSVDHLDALSHHFEEQRSEMAKVPQERAVEQ